MTARHDERAALSFSKPAPFLVLPLVLALAACPRPEEPRVEEEAEPAPEAEAEPGHLSVRALYSDDDQEADGARFTVVGPDGEQVAGPTRRSSFDLPAGTYQVGATLGEAEGTAEAEVRPGERAELDVVLDAGVLQLDARLVEDGPSAANPRFTIVSPERDIRGEREVITGPTRRTSFTLPAGSYVVRATEGEASAEVELEIEAGERTETTIVFDAGLLHAEAVEADGSEVEDRLRFTVLSAEEDLRGQRETITGPTTRKEFVLPAREYLLQARVGDRVAQQQIEIEAGERLDVKITMPAEGEEAAED